VNYKRERRSGNDVGEWQECPPEAHAGLSAPTIPEADFIPQNVIPLEQNARDERKLRKFLQNPVRVKVKGGKRVVRIAVDVPIEQYAGLQRFEGVTDSDKVNTIMRMANRRVDEVARQGAEAMAKAQESAGEQPEGAQG